MKHLHILTRGEKHPIYLVITLACNSTFTNEEKYTNCLKAGLCYGCVTYYTIYNSSAEIKANQTINRGLFSIVDFRD